MIHQLHTIIVSSKHDIVVSGDSVCLQHRELPPQRGGGERPAAAGQGEVRGAGSDHVSVSGRGLVSNQMCLLSFVTCLPQALVKEADQLAKHGVRVRVLGNTSLLPAVGNSCCDQI